MAVKYFTSNASSGNGTLASVYSLSSAGDVIVPDPALGTPVVIAGAVALSRGDSSGVVTISGDIAFNLSSSTTRVVVYASTNFIGVTFTGSDRSVTDSTTRGLIVVTGDATVSSFNRCVFAGSRARGEVGIVARNASSTDYETTTFLNCAFLGLSGVAGVTSYLVAPPEKSRAVNCSFIGILDADVNILSENMIDCKTDDADLVAPPPSNWSSSTWTPTAWKSWNPHIVSSSEQARGYNSTGERYDLEGVPRVNGTLGAFETVDADLYWVGVDANGDAVETPSLDSADGWATDRFATVGGTTAPADVASLFVGDAVTFAGTFGRYTAGLTTTLTTGGGAVSIAAQYVVDPQSTNAARVGRGGLTLTGDSTLTLLDGLDLDHLTMPTPGNNFIIHIAADFELESYAIQYGVRLYVARATIGNLTLNGGYLTVTDRLDVDDLTIVNAPLYIESPALVCVSASITFSGGAVVGQGARAYLSAPSNQTLQGGGFIRLYSDAAASDFVATTKKFKTSFSWNAATVTTLEQTAPEYALISATASAADPPSADITGASTFRIWGGDDWLTASTSPAPLFKFWQVAPWASALASVDESAYNVAVYGASPNIERETTEE